MNHAGGVALRGAAAAAVLAVAVATVVLLVKSSGSNVDREAAVPRPAPQAARPTPTLYCEFYNFMHNATVVSFLFAVDQRATPPGFFEMSTQQPDGSQTAFVKDERPQWAYAIVDDTATITSSDGATRVVLYGLKPKIGGVFWTEAGIRSDTYKNLDGKCRQAYFGPPQPGAPR